MDSPELPASADHASEAQLPDMPEPAVVPAPDTSAEQSITAGASAAREAVKVAVEVKPLDADAVAAAEPLGSKPVRSSESVSSMLAALRGSESKVSFSSATDLTNMANVTAKRSQLKMVNSRVDLLQVGLSPGP